eukprot:6026387-Amphidinium_carterae.1
MPRLQAQTAVVDRNLSHAQSCRGLSFTPMGSPNLTTGARCDYLLCLFSLGIHLDMLSEF